jgi:hypothetical protein
MDNQNVTHPLYIALAFHQAAKDICLHLYIPHELSLQKASIYASKRLVGVRKNPFDEASQKVKVLLVLDFIKLSIEDLTEWNI